MLKDVLQDWLCCSSSYLRIALLDVVEGPVGDVVVVVRRSSRRRERAASDDVVRRVVALFLLGDECRQSQNSRTYIRQRRPSRR